MEREISSNAPIGYYMYEYPKEVQEKRGQFGAKVFFYHASFHFDTPNFAVNSQLYTDYHWISRLVKPHPLFSFCPTDLYVFAFHRDDVWEYFDFPTARYLDRLLPW